jgi:hypothetical protein
MITDQIGHTMIDLPDPIALPDTDRREPGPYGFNARTPLDSRSPVQAAETRARIVGGQGKPLDVAAFQSFAD